MVTNIYFHIVQNNADPKYAWILLGIGIAELLICGLATFIHHKSWESEENVRLNMMIA